MLIFGAVTKSYITRMFKSNSGEPYAGKLHVRFLEEFISNCLIIREGENLLMRMKEPYEAYLSQALKASWMSLNFINPLLPVL